MTTVPPNTTPSFTVKVMDSVFSYPSGAVISVKVYFPSARFSISCGFFSETQLSTAFPFASVTTSFAPGSSFFVVISCLLITTLPSFGASYITTVPPMASPSFTVKVIDSATLYPSGAVISIRIYSPSSNPDTKCALLELIQRSTSFPLASLMISSAPGSSSKVVMSFLLIATLLLSGFGTSSSLHAFTRRSKKLINPSLSS